MLSETRTYADKDKGEDEEASPKVNKKQQENNYLTLSETKVHAAVLAFGAGKNAFKCQTKQ